jgi:hypothetical protein
VKVGDNAYKPFLRAHIGQTQYFPSDTVDRGTESNSLGKVAMPVDVERVPAPVY